MWHVWGIREINSGFLVGKSERNKPLENPRDRPSNNTKTSLAEIGWES
jgi:hypothetical protein